MTDAEYMDEWYRQVGRAFVNLVCVTSQLGHNTVIGTLTNGYSHPPDTGPVRFVHDALLHDYVPELVAQSPLLQTHLRQQVEAVSAAIGLDSR